MTTFDELASMLDDIAQELPQDFYKELNGGIILSPDVKIHPESNESGNLLILGEYHNDRKGYGGLGRYIVIYFGSFMKLYSYFPVDRQKQELRRVLVHEFMHHLESLAGERDLEIQDAHDMAKYRQRATIHPELPPSLHIAEKYNLGVSNRVEEAHGRL